MWTRTRLALVCGVLGLGILAYVLWVVNRPIDIRHAQKSETQHAHGAGASNTSAVAHSTAPAGNSAAKRPELGVFFAPCTQPEYPGPCVRREKFQASLTNYFAAHAVASERQGEILAILADAQVELELLSHAASMEYVRGEPVEEEQLSSANEQVIAEAYQRLGRVLTPEQLEGWGRMFQRDMLMADLLMRPFNVPNADELKQQITHRMLLGDSGDTNDSP